MAFSDTAHALLIGIGSYKNPGLAPLPSCPNDIKALSSLLTDPSRCGYLPEGVSVLNGDEAAADKVRKGLGDLSRATDQQSTALIYFSGHGARVQLGEKWETYICPWDTDRTDIARTAISGSEFSDLISSIKAKKLLVILDTCHAGSSATPRDAELSWESGLAGQYLERLARGSGRVVLASSKEDQVSYNYSAENHGLFTWHLLQALRGGASVRGDGRVGVLDLYCYVSEMVRKARPDQEPVLHAKDVDDNFPVALAPATLAAARAVPQISNIREKIIVDPAAGGLELSNYVAADAARKSKEIDVGIGRAKITDAIRDIQLFGPSQDSKADKYRGVFTLLRVCAELEQEAAA